MYFIVFIFYYFHSLLSLFIIFFLSFLFFIIFILYYLYPPHFLLCFIVLYRPLSFLFFIMFYHLHYHPHHPYNPPKGWTLKKKKQMEKKFSTRPIFWRAPALNNAPPTRQNFEAGTIPAKVSPKCQKTQEVVQSGEKNIPKFYAK